MLWIKIFHSLDFLCLTFAVIKAQSFVNLEIQTSSPSISKLLTYLLPYSYIIPPVLKELAIIWLPFEKLSSLHSSLLMTLEVLCYGVIIWAVKRYAKPKEPSNEVS
jgi:hypothetical protein